MPAETTPPTDLTRLRDELERQFRLMRTEMPIRLLATVMAYSIGLLYLPASFVIPITLVNLAGEIVTYRLFLDCGALARSRLRRVLAMATAFMIETCFTLPSVVMWHLDDPYAKVLAVGLIAGSMMHLATERSIYLPLGIAGVVALSILTFGSNTLYWLNLDTWEGLVISTLCICVSMGYFVEAMLSTHRLHRDTAAGQRAAMEANAAKDRLLATISHELRTPLNGIVGMAHAERRHAATPEAAERMDLLVASAGGLTTLLDDILDFSAARDGRLPIRPAAAHPGAEIEHTISLFAPAIERQGVRLDLHLDPNLEARGVFDAQRLRQCLSNLLSNALKHGQGAPVRVSARRDRLPNGHPILEVLVEDRGPGIAAADAALAFEPFGQLSQAPGGLGRNHGLGLSITRALARQMGGDLVLEPTPGQKGARFRLYVKLYPALDAPGAEAAPAALPRLDGCRVLVVDDVATNRIVASNYLRLAGALPFEAAGGEEAVAQLRVSGADAVLLDLHMPGLDGMATLAGIRDLPGPVGRVPVIAMTADAEPGQRQRLAEAGINGYLSKPLTPERMVAELVRTLHAQSAQDGAPQPSGAFPPALTGTDP